jgi:hypothetical protein
MSIASKRDRRPSHVETPARRRRRRASAASIAPQLFETGLGVPAIMAAEPGPEATDERLDEVVRTTWAALLAGHPVECPVCGGPLTLEHGCSTCGSKLS